VRRTILSLTLLASLVAGASPLLAGGLDVRLGAFFPRGGETLFQDDRTLYNVSTSDFTGFTGGVEYNQVVVKNVEIGLSIDGYGQTVRSNYRDYTRPDGSEIHQTLKLSTLPLGLTVRFVPTSKRTKVAPYIGGGMDAIYWEYQEYGDFIDFLDPEYTIHSDSFRSSGWAFGLHVAGGCRFYLNRDFAIVGEGRYQWAHEDMGGDFAPNAPGLVNTIDLSGWSATVGVHVRF